MELRLKCLEWTNLNRKAQNIKSAKSGKNKSNPESLACLEITANSENKLACLGSNQSIPIFDQNNLKRISELAAPKGTNSIGMFKRDQQLLSVCGNQGVLKCWDLRDTEKPALEFESMPSSRDFLCVDINAADSLIAVGTNKYVDDALILVYDLRSNQRPLYKLKESHSNDVTQIKFHPNMATRFSSAGLDGLVCFYDVELENQPTEPRNASNSGSESSDSSGDESENDPDIMDQCLNTESCVSRIGYLSSNPDVLSNVDRLFAITTTNDFFLWDLINYDTIYENKSPNRNLQDSDKNPQVEDFFFDCFYGEKDRPLICKTSSSGHIKIFDQDSLVFDQNLNTCKEDRAHRDLIRTSYWNVNHKSLFTGGEDGFIIKWQLADSKLVSSIEPRKRKIDENESKKYFSNKKK